MKAYLSYKLTKWAFGSDELKNCDCLRTLDISFYKRSQRDICCIYAAKIWAQIVISVGLLVYLFQGHVQYVEISFDDSSWTAEGNYLAIYSCKWAYGGYNIVNEIAEELIEPKKKSSSNTHLYDRRS